MEDIDFSYPMFLTEDVVSVPDWVWSDPAVIEEHSDGVPTSTQTSPWNDSDSGWSELSSPPHSYPQIVSSEITQSVNYQQDLNEILDFMDVDESDDFNEKNPWESETDVTCEAVLSANECDVTNYDAVSGVPNDEDPTVVNVTETKGQAFHTVRERHSYSRSPNEKACNDDADGKSTFLDEDASDGLRGSKRSKVVKIITVPKRRRIEDEADVINFISEKNRKNAETAKLNREKKKAYIQDMDDQIIALRSDKRQLELQKEDLEGETDCLRKEVKYLRAVLLNDSCLAGLLKNIPRVSQVALKSFEPRKYHRGPVPEEISGGVCLHVCKEKVSLEFCASCSLNRDSLGC